MSKKNYHSKYFLQANHKMNKTWKQINKIVYQNNQKTHLDINKTEKGNIKMELKKIGDE